MGIMLLCFGANNVTAQNWDINTLRHINLNRNEAFDQPFIVLDETVASLDIAAPIGMFTAGLIKKDSALKRQAIVVAVAVAGNASASYLVKHVVNRARPYDLYPEIDNVVSPNTASFPSGHTANAFALATSLTLETKKWYVAVPSYAWAGTVTYSRLHLGVHYPTDVIAGAAIGSASAVVTHYANKWLVRKQNERRSKRF